MRSRARPAPEPPGPRCARSPGSAALVPAKSGPRRGHAGPLVYSPRIRSERWDSRAQGLLIVRSPFQWELLSPGSAHGRGGDGPGRAGPATFRATQFRTFMRQLYRHSFHRVPARDGAAVLGDAMAWLHDSNLFFCRDRPDLLLGIKRRCPSCTKGFPRKHS